MNSIWRTLNFNLNNRFHFHFSLWCNVNNAEDIQTKIHSKQFPTLTNAAVVLIDSDVIIDIVQVGYVLYFLTNKYDSTTYL